MSGILIMQGFHLEPFWEYAVVGSAGLNDQTARQVILSPELSQMGVLWAFFWYDIA